MKRAHVIPGPAVPRRRALLSSLHMHRAGREARTEFLATLGWAFYLACSWTWVIGMYLPVLLVRELGVAGWLAFAVPNVIGAAGMGWVLGSREQALRLVERHAGAIRAFSGVTVAFQIFVLLWLLPTIVGIGSSLLVLLALSCAIALPVAAALATRLNAVAVWFFSAAVFAMLGASGALEFPQGGGSQPAVGLAGLIPACALGFVFCPYLDVTFLNARSRMDAAGARWAFTLGFGVFFLAMIVFAMLYAPALLEGRLRGTLAWLLAGHLALQVCFTVSAHTALTRMSRGNLLAVIVAGLLGVLALIGELRGFALFELSAGELIYRSFMGFYGVVFPAYVLLVVMAGARQGVYWTTCAAALPFFAIGFLAGWMAWAAVGVAVIVVVGVYELLRGGGPARQRT